MRVTSIPFVQQFVISLVAAATVFRYQAADAQSEPRPILKINRDALDDPSLFRALKNPKCSYCNVQHEKGFVKDDDRVIAWLRSSHDGGAIPLRHFLSASRVINDTYGIFFYDPDGGYVSSFERSPGYRHTYEFHGWRNGVMVVKGNDGSLVSALTGRIFDGPRKGQRLKRIPSMVTDWKPWLTLHPESVAYRMYEGKTFLPLELPTGQSPQARKSMGDVDPRLEPFSPVIGVEVNGRTEAWQLDPKGKLKAVNATVGDQPVAVLWDPSTQTAVSFNRELGKQRLTLRVDPAASSTAPFKDDETGSHWTLAGRAVDGELRGKELDWIPSVQSHWSAWAAEYPETELHTQR